MPTPRLLFTVAALALACGPPRRSEPVDPTSGPAAAPPADAVATAPTAAPSRLVPREVLFGNPERTGVRMSADGRQILFIAPKDGVLNVWVAPIDAIDSAKAVTSDENRGIRGASWSYDSRFVVYRQDQGGDENWHLYRTDVATGETLDLTPLPGVAAQPVAASRAHPRTMLVGINDRDPARHDLYEVDLVTGKRKLVRKNEGFSAWLVDDDLVLRGVQKPTADGGDEILVPRGKSGWRALVRFGAEDSLASAPEGFDGSGRMYLADSRGRDSAALVRLDPKTGKVQELHASQGGSISALMRDPETHAAQAVLFTTARDEWQVLDPAVANDFAALARLDEGELHVVDQTADGRRWLVAYRPDDGPARYHVWNRGEQKGAFLFSADAELDALELAPMHAVTIRARDGLELVSYLTLPRVADPDGDGKPSEPVPLVLLVHGGPWGRDTWGWNPYHQWLQDRGYAVLSVNFRGSTGLGKALVNAGDRQWAAAMHDDLLDAVKWAVDAGIARRDKVAIMGTSYGGYATLVGLTFTPKAFACGVDVVGPSNLVTLLETIPPYWESLKSLFARRVGDVTTAEGRELLRERSPLTHVAKIERPLLIGQGANDPRVKQAESDQIVAAMQAAKIPVTYVLFPDEGHGFARPTNQLAFTAVTEAFLATCLGGAHEPFGDDFTGSTITVPAGAEHVEGLPAALAKR
ncbi:MAG TPA: S9 family peptidase [Nannocystaceae bacterium]|nr:S9 family peptidase [Nannocystaceae bacterium]